MSSHPGCALAALRHLRISTIVVESLGHLILCRTNGLGIQDEVECFRSFRLRMLGNRPSSWTEARWVETGRAWGSGGGVDDASVGMAVKRVRDRVAQEKEFRQKLEKADEMLNAGI